MKNIIPISIIIILFLISGLYCVKLFGGFLGTADGSDYAGLARSLVQGHGFSLGHIYPLSFDFVKGIPQPNNMWAPGYIIFQAAMFCIFGISDKAMLIGLILTVWLLILTAFYLGSNIFDRHFTIILAMLIGLNQVILNTAIDCTPEIFTAVLLTLSLIILLKHLNPLRLALSGVFFGIAILSRYQIAILAIPFVIIIVGNNLRHVGIWSIALSLIIIPWLLRNWIVLGNPFFTLQSYGEFTKGMGRFDDYYYTYRSFTPMTFWHTIYYYPLSMLKKIAGGLVYYSRMLPVHFNYIGLIPFVFGFIKLKNISGIKSKIAKFAYISTAIIIAISCVDGHSHRHLAVIQVFLSATMLIGFQLMMKEFNFLRYGKLPIILTIILFIAARAPFQEKRLAQIAQASQDAAPHYKEISSLTKENEIIVSNLSDAVWWYADRYSIWIPVNYADLIKLASYQKFDYILLKDPELFTSKLSGKDYFDFISRTQVIYSKPDFATLYRFREISD